MFWSIGADTLQIYVYTKDSMKQTPTFVSLYGTREHSTQWWYAWLANYHSIQLGRSMPPPIHLNSNSCKSFWGGGGSGKKHYFFLYQQMTREIPLTQKQWTIWDDVSRSIGGLLSKKKPAYELDQFFASFPLWAYFTSKKRLRIANINSATGNTQTYRRHAIPLANPWCRFRGH